MMSVRTFPSVILTVLTPMYTDPEKQIGKEEYLEYQRLQADDINDGDEGAAKWFEKVEEGSAEKPINMDLVYVGD